jgi:hypothetical protein
VIGTTLDKGAELDALAKLPKPQQEALIEKAKAGEKVSALLRAPGRLLDGRGGRVIDAVAFAQSVMHEHRPNQKNEHRCGDRLVCHPEQELLAIWRHATHPTPA